MPPKKCTLQENNIPRFFSDYQPLFFPMLWTVQIIRRCSCSLNFFLTTCKTGRCEGHWLVKCSNESSEVLRLDFTNRRDRVALNGHFVENKEMRRRCASDWPANLFSCTPSTTWAKVCLFLLHWRNTRVRWKYLQDADLRHGPRVRMHSVASTLLTFQNRSLNHVTAEIQQRTQIFLRHMQLQLNHFN